MKVNGRIIFLFIFFLSGNVLFSFTLDESVGGVSTSLGGIILDKDISGFNALYNPSLIPLTFSSKVSELNISIAEAASPFGVSDINIGGLGITYARKFGSLLFGSGFSVQMKLVTGGLNEYNIGLSGSVFIPAHLNVSNFIEFDGLAVSLKPKVDYYKIDGAPLGMIGFKNNQVAFDFDGDFTLNFNNKTFLLGVYVLNALNSTMSFFPGSSSQTNYARGLIIHSKINLIKNLDFYGAINLLGSKHLVNENNFFASLNKLANKYFGLEANFKDVLYARLGLNEGQLSGGIGIKANNLMINVGVLPIHGVSYYYQLDISYKMSLGSL